MTWERIGDELKERIERLMGTETVNFCDLRTDELRAIAVHEPYVVERMVYWDELKIYNDPLKLSEESYTPLNPNDNAGFRSTKILTFDFLRIRKHEDVKYQSWLDSILDRNRIRHTKYDFERKQDPEGVSRVVSCKTKVIPIYAGNEDFLAVMAHIEAGGK